MMLFDCISPSCLRKGEELKAPRHASAAATRDGHVTTHNIVPTITLIIYILFLYLYSISLLISISYLLISNLFLLSSISRNIGRSFLKHLGGSKIYN